VRVAAEKALPFGPLNPNAETVAAMKAARRSELVKVGKPDKLLRSLFIPANVLSEGSRSPAESSILFLFETDFAGG
jgi:hypothetical protein